MLCCHASVHVQVERTFLAAVATADASDLTRTMACYNGIAETVAPFYQLLKLGYRPTMMRFGAILTNVSPDLQLKESVCTWCDKRRSIWRADLSAASILRLHFVPNGISHVVVLCVLPMHLIWLSAPRSSDGAASSQTCSRACRSWAVLSRPNGVADMDVVGALLICICLVGLWLDWKYDSHSTSTNGRHQPTC
eukprot:SAG31_NODE_341_length_17459_cov_29.188123_6_plen_194_part_00